MGVTPIEYRPWEGERTGYYRRFLVISKTVLMHKLKSKWIIALIIIGAVLAHVFPIIFNTLLPHEELTSEMMVGELPPEPGGYYVNREGDISISQANNIIGIFYVNGSIALDGTLELHGRVTGSGIIEGTNRSISDTTVTESGLITVEGMLLINGTLQIGGTQSWIDNGSIEGEGQINGDCLLTGDGLYSRIPAAEESEPQERAGGYLKSGFLIIFTILLASLVCSDLIAEDLSDNSFILYFSRPIKARDYLGGKILGALWVLGLFCFLPLIIFCLAVTGTQSGDDYGSSFKVLGSTIVAGLLTTLIFVPYGILISSMTKRKTYATIGIFMSFFAMIIIGNMFSTFDNNWVLVDPTRVLYYSYDVIYGYSIPEGINGGLLGAVLFVILVIPLVIVYLRIYLKAVGK